MHWHTGTYGAKRPLDIVNSFYVGHFCAHSQVHADDETTKICRNCFNMINEYFPFRMACSARNVNYLLQKIKKATTPAPIECVSLTDSEGESSDDDGDNGDGVNDIAQNAVGVAVDANK